MLPLTVGWHGETSLFGKFNKKFENGADSKQGWHDKTSLFENGNKKFENGVDTTQGWHDKTSLLENYNKKFENRMLPMTEGWHGNTAFTDPRKMLEVMDEDPAEEKWPETFHQQRLTKDFSADEKDHETNSIDPDDEWVEQSSFKTNFHPLNKLQKPMFYKKENSKPEKISTRMKEDLNTKSKQVNNFSKGDKYYRTDIAGPNKILKGSKDKVSSASEQFLEAQLRQGLNSKLTQKEGKEIKNHDNSFKDVKGFENSLSGRWFSNDESREDAQEEIDDVQNTDSILEETESKQDFAPRLEQFLERSMPNLDISQDNIQSLLTSVINNPEIINPEMKHVHSRNERFNDISTRSDFLHGKRQNSENFKTSNRNHPYDIHAAVNGKLETVKKLFRVKHPSPNTNLKNTDLLAPKQKWKISKLLVDGKNDIRQGGLHSVTALLKDLQKLHHGNSLTKQNNVKEISLSHLQDIFKLGSTNNQSIAIDRKGLILILLMAGEEKMPLEIGNILQLLEQQNVSVFLIPMDKFSEFIRRSNKQANEFAVRLVNTRQPVTSLDENHNITGRQKQLKVSTSQVQKLSPTDEENIKGNVLQKKNDNLMQDHRTLIDVVKNRKDKFRVVNSAKENNNIQAKNDNSFAKMNNKISNENAFLRASDKNFFNRDLAEENQSSVGSISFKETNNNSRSQLLNSSTKQNKSLPLLIFRTIFSTPGANNRKLLFRRFFNILQNKQLDEETRGKRFRDIAKELHTLHPVIGKEIMQAIPQLHNGGFKKSQVVRNKEDIKKLHEKLLEGRKQKTGKASLQGSLKVNYNGKVFRGPTEKDEESLSKIYKKRVSSDTNSIRIGALRKKGVTKDFVTNRNFDQNYIGDKWNSPKQFNTYAPGENYNYQEISGIKESPTGKEVHKLSFSEKDIHSGLHIPKTFEMFDKKLIKDVTRLKIEFKNKRNNFVDVIKNENEPGSVARQDNVSTSPSAKRKRVSSVINKKLDANEVAEEESKERVTALTKNTVKEKDKMILHRDLVDEMEQTQNVEDEASSNPLNGAADRGEKTHINKDHKIETQLENSQSVGGKAVIGTITEAAYSIGPENTVKVVAEIKLDEKNNGELSTTSKTEEILENNSGNDVDSIKEDSFLQKRVGDKQNLMNSILNEVDNNVADNKSKTNEIGLEISSDNGNSVSMKHGTKIAIQSKEIDNLPPKVIPSVGAVYKSSTSQAGAVQIQNNNSITAKNNVRQYRTESSDYQSSAEDKVVTKIINVEETKELKDTKTNHPSPDLYSNQFASEEVAERNNNEKIGKSSNTDNENHSTSNVEGNSQIMLKVLSFPQDASFTDGQEHTETKKSGKDFSFSKKRMIDESSPKLVSTSENAARMEIYEMKKGINEANEAAEVNLFEKDNESTNKYISNANQLKMLRQHTEEENQKTASSKTGITFERSEDTKSIEGMLEDDDFIVDANNPQHRIAAEEQSGMENQHHEEESKSLKGGNNVFSTGFTYRNEEVTRDGQNQMTDQPKKKVELKMFKIVGDLKSQQPKQTEFKLKPIGKKVFELNKKMDKTEKSSTNISRKDNNISEETEQFQENGKKYKMFEDAGKSTDKSAISKNIKIDLNGRSANAVYIKNDNSIGEISPQAGSRNTESDFYLVKLTAAPSKETTKLHTELHGGSMENHATTNGLVQSLNTRMGDFLATELAKNTLNSFSSTDQNRKANNMEHPKDHPHSIIESLTEALKRKLSKIGKPFDAALHKIMKSRVPASKQRSQILWNIMK